MTHTRPLLLAALLLGAPTLAAAQAPAAPAAPSTTSPAPALAIPKEMTPYYLALYYRGDQWIGEETPQRQQIIADHLRHIRAMIEQKRYVFAGPMLDGGNLQGILILSATSPEEAARFVQEDPGVRAGFFKPELHPAMLPSLAGVQVKY